MLSASWAFLYSLCWHTHGLVEVIKSLTLTTCFTGHVVSLTNRREVWEPWCAAPSGKTERISRSARAGRGPMSVSSLHIRVLCWIQFGTLRWHWQLKIQPGCLWLAWQREERCTFKVSLKCDFLGTFHQEIACLRKSGISISSLISSTSFLSVNEKESFLYSPLLLKLKSLKAAVYLLHCSRVLEGSQVSFQPGEQQKLVLYKWQAATNHIPFTPSPGWGSAAYGEQSTIPLLCSLHATKNSAPFTTVERWNTLAAAQLMY